MQLHPHNYSGHVGCEVACFLGVQPDRPFGAGGDSGSLVFDGEGKAVGLYSAGIVVGRERVIAPLDISFVYDINVIFKDIEAQLFLSDLKFANAK